MKNKLLLVEDDVNYTPLQASTLEAVLRGDDSKYYELPPLRALTLEAVSGHSE